jgi:hypothetical protein
MSMTCMFLNRDMARFFRISHPKPPAPLFPCRMSDGGTVARDWTGTEMTYMTLLTGGQLGAIRDREYSVPSVYIQDLHGIKSSQGLLGNSIGVGKGAGRAADVVEELPMVRGAIDQRCLW